MARQPSAPRVEASPLPDEPNAEFSAAPTDFVASLDDLQDLAAQPAEPEPEFVPEGGMSTQSLMREFERLAPELQAAAAELGVSACRVARRRSQHVMARRKTWPGWLNASCSIGSLRMKPQPEGTLPWSVLGSEVPVIKADSASVEEQQA